MIVVLFTVADGAVIDQQTNRLSIFNVLEEMSAPGFPAMHSQLSIIAVLQKGPNEKEDPKLNIRISLDRSELVDFPITLSFEGVERSRFVGSIAGLLLPSAGTLKFDLRHRSRSISSWRVPVREVQTPAQTG